MALAQKQITCQFTLANGEFLGGGNTAIVQGLRTHLQAEVALEGYASMALEIYGMPLQTMQQLATIGPQFNQVYKNDIDVLVGDDESGLSLLFSGNIYTAFIDGTQQPNVCLRVVAAPFANANVAPAEPTSSQGPADAANLVQSLAGQIGASGFENNGVSVQLASPYYYGSAWGQIRQIANDANFDFMVDRGVLVISPRGTPRQGQTTLISPETGMVGYPAFVQNSVIVRSLYDPDVRVGGLVAIESSILPATGLWYVYRVSYDMAAVEPGGPWFMTLECVPEGTT